MKSKMQRDVNWKEILYLACLCTYIIISTLVGEGSILTYIPLVKWEHYIAFINMIKALLVLKMIFDIAEEPRMIFLIAITETIGFMVYTHNPTDVFLSMALWFLCAGKNVRARKITECLFGSHLVSFIILESLCVAGIVFTPEYSRIKNSSACVTVLAVEKRKTEAGSLSGNHNYNGFCENSYRLQYCSIASGTAIDLHCAV